MTKKEMKEYLESIHEKWHTRRIYDWEHIFKEGIIKRGEFVKIYQDVPPITGDMEPFVNGILRKLYPTKLEQALR